MRARARATVRTLVKGPHTRRGAHATLRTRGPRGRSGYRVSSSESRYKGPRPCAARSRTGPRGGAAPTPSRFAPEHASGQRVGERAVFVDHGPVHDGRADAFGQLMRLLVGGGIVDRCEIEDQDIGDGAGAQLARGPSADTWPAATSSSEWPPAVRWRRRSVT